MGEGTFDDGSGPITGHVPGGVAMFYRRELSNIVKPLYLDVDCAIGITIEKKDIIVHIICVYLPYCSRENENEFLNKWVN